MFGIEDPWIYSIYLLAVACVLFAAWYGIRNWNKDDDKDETR